jgi:hypothetical protein
LRHNRNSPVLCSMCHMVRSRWVISIRAVYQSAEVSRQRIIENRRRTPRKRKRRS